MKIQIVSDLHLEFGNDITQILDCKCDMLIIAGDVYPGPKVINLLTQIYKSHISKPKIIFVPGNHEYYGYSKEYVDNCFNTYDYLRDYIIILNNDSFIYNDIVFIGSTGWWDESNGKIGFSQIQSLNDFRMIQDISNFNMGKEWGVESRQFFESELEFYKDYEKVICISHNGPTKKSHPKFHGSVLNTCFQNDWKDLIEHYQPNYWIYGHTHEYMGYKVDKTRCICNPMGYPHESNKYSPNLTIEI